MNKRHFKLTKEIQTQTKLKSC